MEEKTFIVERDDALFAAYKNALRQPDVKSHQQAIRVAISSPTSQFWIEPYRAYREILWCKNGRRPFRISRHRKELVEDLYREYLRLKEQPMFRDCSTYFVSQFAACRIAPRGFYISELTATRIIHRKRYEKRQ